MYCLPSGRWAANEGVYGKGRGEKRCHGGVMGAWRLSNLRLFRKGK